MKSSQIIKALTICYDMIESDIEVSDIDIVSHDKYEQVIISFKHRDGSEDKYYHNFVKS